MKTPAQTPTLQPANAAEPVTHTPEITIRLSDGRIVTLADKPSVDSWGAYRKVLVGNPALPASYEVAAHVTAGDDLEAAMTEVAQHEEAMIRGEE